MTTDGCGGSSVLALDDLLVDFKTQQRELLLLAVDKAITSAIVNQSEMLDAVKSKVEARHRQAVDELRSELQKTQPSLLDQVIAQTLTVDLNPGLTSWIQDQDKKDEARDCIKKLQEHLKGRQGNAFRSDFEALLVVYMDFLQIPMTRGARLNFRIEDFKEALHEKATDELLNLVYRVRWGCNGVRTIGNARSHDATPLVGGTWGQPPLPSDSGSPDKKSQLAPPADFAKKETDKPSQAMLKLVPTFKFYYDRPTELPKENDRTRMAMFARMINHINALPKATLCPFLKGHDPTCPLSHTYLEVMTYNPLFKRLICRQTSHYWGNQIQEDENCACVHVDTGLTWEWMEESRDKRLYCPRGSKCTNNKCIKSHSFEEMCWYNPSYKTKKCEKRAHDYIIRSRGTMTPPLDCHYYHFEEGRNADKREFSIEDDHVGKPVKMLFIERSHKPLADALEALRYARANNL
ncbi:hypothetical protein PHYBOEH_000975 [Phytophthora boehmeriae]|uniref:Uncharacterized protein n=1 Tax=Phytophthora boehmeriae TaxID=109152 RepID=A0A8T1WVY3_9STRA|nr:hypothetical protein PHYBOEH_000975 [Phytophthora boehmeriae]